MVLHMCGELSLKLHVVLPSARHNSPAIPGSEIGSWLVAHVLTARCQQEDIPLKGHRLDVDQDSGRMR